MKIVGLCFLLILVFVCLAGTSQAQESRTGPNDQAVQNSPDSGQYFIVKPDRATPEIGESFCAYLRTYRVRREHRGSDEVSPAGYTTCVPSKRFELRSAVQVQSEAAPRQ